MANYGIHFLAGSKKMTPKQFGNAIAGMIGGYTSNVELEIQMQREKAAIRSLFQIASIVFQRIVSRTPFDEEYRYEVVKDGEVKIKEHEPDDDVVRYDWTMTVAGQNSKTFSCRDFIAMDPDFGMEFNDKKDINLILNTLLKSGLKPKIITNEKGEDVPDFSISFDNSNERFKTLEYGKYRKGPTEPKYGKEYVHGVTETQFSYQAPMGFYAITMKEYEAFIATHKADVWRTLSQKMLRQRVEKIFSEKKINQILKIVDAATPEDAFKKAMSQEVEKNKARAQKKAQKELEKENAKVSDSEVESNILNIPENKK